MACVAGALSRSRGVPSAKRTWNRFWLSTRSTGRSESSSSPNRRRSCSFQSMTWGGSPANTEMAMGSASITLTLRRRSKATSAARLLRCSEEAAKVASAEATATPCAPGSSEASRQPMASTPRASVRSSTGRKRAAFPPRRSAQSVIPAIDRSSTATGTPEATAACSHWSSAGTTAPDPAPKLPARVKRPEASRIASTPARARSRPE